MTASMDTMKISDETRVKKMKNMGLVREAGTEEKRPKVMSTGKNYLWEILEMYLDLIGKKVKKGGNTIVIKIDLDGEEDSVRILKKENSILIKGNSLSKLEPMTKIDKEFILARIEYDNEKEKEIFEMFTKENVLGLRVSIILEYDSIEDTFLIRGRIGMNEIQRKLILKIKEK